MSTIYKCDQCKKKIKNIHDKAVSIRISDYGRMLSEKPSHSLDLCKNCSKKVWKVFGKYFNKKSK